MVGFWWGQLPCTTPRDGVGQAGMLQCKGLGIREEGGSLL